MKDTCGSVMGPNPIVLTPETSLGEALHTLRRAELRYLPVVDAGGHLVGVFSSLRLLALLLPQVMSINMGKTPLELNFMRTSLEDLQQRFRELADRPIAEFLIRRLTYCTPETSLMEVVNLVHKYQARVFITEPETHKLLGVVSTEQLIDQIMGTK